MKAFWPRDGGNSVAAERSEKTAMGKVPEQLC